MAGYSLQAMIDAMSANLLKTDAEREVEKAMTKKITATLDKDIDERIEHHMGKIEVLKAVPDGVNIHKEAIAYHGSRVKYYMS